MPAAHPTQPPPIKVLVFCAGDEAGQGAKTATELQAILNATESKQDKVNVVPCPATRVDDLFQKIRTHQPDVLHFAAHGNTQGQVLFEGGETFSIPDLADFLVNTHRKPCVLIAAACNIGQHRVRLAKCCDFLIGCDGGLAAGAAIAFSKGFYEELSVQTGAENSRYEVCFEAGDAERKRSGIPEAKSLRLLSTPNRAPLWKLIRPVTDHEHKEKNKAVFGNQTVWSCPTSGAFAEVGGIARSASAELELLQQFNAIEAYSNKLFVLSRNSLSKVTQSPNLVSPDSPVCMFELELDSLNAAMTRLLGTVKKCGEVDPLVDLGSGSHDPWEVLETVLLCKFRKYQAASDEVAAFCHAAALIPDLRARHEREDWSGLCSDAGSIATATRPLITFADRCIKDRLYGTVNALDRFGTAAEMVQAVGNFTSRLPHYDRIEKPGHPLWVAVR